MKYLFYCIIFSVFLLFSACSDGSDTVTGVCYDLKFATTWSNETIPASSFPSNPHFSPLIGATHTQAVTIWKTGSKSSKGIEIMAETGGTSKLRGEISHLGVHDIITGGGTTSPGSVTTRLYVTETASYVTVVSMLAPSPDWFVGISGENLLNSDKTWKQSLTKELFVYDAGTDSGTTFTAANQDTTPKENIRRLPGNMEIGDFDTKPVGSFTFTRCPST